jgi:hypothetical protein
MPSGAVCRPRGSNSRRSDGGPSVLQNDTTNSPITRCWYGARASMTWASARPGALGVLGPRPRAVERVRRTSMGEQADGSASQPEDRRRDMEHEHDDEVA